jgi:hypothetical protein
MRCDHIASARAAQVAGKIVLVIGILLTVGSPICAQAQGNALVSREQACPNDTGGITLPPGFCATIFADNIGHARHLVVAPDGVVYVNTWSGRYYGNDKPPAGGFLVALQDTKGDGRAAMSFASDRPWRKAPPVAPASRSTTARSMPR